MSQLCRIAAGVVAVLGVIASFVIAGAQGDFNIIGILISLLGVALTVLLFLALAQILDNQELLAMKLAALKDPEEQGGKERTPTKTYGAVPVKKPIFPQAVGPWVCPHCATHNEAGHKSCKNCLKPR